MNHTTRRTFLSNVAHSAAALTSLAILPESIRKALAIPAHSASGTLKDVQHIVVLMQENRSFDHYLGHLSGVRGYNDRFPIQLVGKQAVWLQPRRDASQGTVAPFHLNTQTTSSQCIGDLDHSWHKTHAAFNNGRYDRWPRYKTDMTMGYHLRQDIPFHYALADAFTVCDQYFCSLPGPTDPNRMFLMTGTNDPLGKGGGPVIDNGDLVDRSDLPAFTWTTYPERLEKSGVSWQIYQEGTNSSDSYEGNFGLNVLANFQNFVEAAEGSALYRRAMTARPLAQLARDVKSNALPQVSWLLPPAAFSEHPKWTPAYGANYIARVLDALTANPEVWSKTVLFLVYDENDGFFDHIVPPQPPGDLSLGKSTVAVADELHTVVNPTHRPAYRADNLPYGLGPRVPMVVISPWSKGGFVCSQVFDHTSVIRFIERRFGVHEPNISAWRRAICGDLTAALDFSRHLVDLPHLPDTRGYRAMADEQCRNLAKPQVPADNAVDFHAQEPGTRPARPIPYDLRVADAVHSKEKRLNLEFDNRGGQGVHFWVYSDDPTQVPRRYTVEAGKSLTDEFPADVRSGKYAWTVYGPNGFVRIFRGEIAVDAAESGAAGAAEMGGAKPDMLTVRDEPINRATVFSLELNNHAAEPIFIVLTDKAYGAPPRELTLLPGARFVSEWNIVASHHWYDISVTLVGQAHYERRYSGHVETGNDSRTDPAANKPVMLAV